MIAARRGRRSVLGLALLLCGLLVAPSVAAAPPEPQSAVVGQLPGGGSYILHPSSGVPLTAISLWYRAPSTGFGPTPIRSLSHFAAQTVAASQPITGTPLGRAVADAGGRFSIDSYTSSVSISALVPATSARAIVRAMTASYFAPVITDAGMHQALTDLAGDAMQEHFKPDAVLRDALFAQLFPEGPAHFEGIAEPSELTKVQLQTVKDFATRAFRAQNAILVIAGAAPADIVSAAVSGRAADPGQTAMEDPIDLRPGAPPAPSTRAFAESGVGYAWIGPAITDEKAATAMDFLADYLFRPDDGVVAREADQRFPDALVNGQFITLHNPGVMVVETAGKDVGAIRTLIDTHLSQLSKPLSAETFAAAREAFVYHLLSDLQTPLETVDNYGWYAVEGNLDYAPGQGGLDGAYFATARSLTPQYVAGIARKYLSRGAAVVTLVPPK